MHGVLIRDKKVLTDEELSLDRSSAEAALALLSSELKGECSRPVSAPGILDEVATSERLSRNLALIQLNPEMGTAWNMRRKILLGSAHTAELNNLLKNELHILDSVMIDMRFTKSYCLWTHRRWVLVKLCQPGSAGLQPPRDIEPTSPILSRERSVVETIIALDNRNFHAWSYRQFLQDEFKLFSPSYDLEYSRKLIETDFSNYSAYYLRMRAVLSLVDGSNDTTDSVDLLDELDLVWNGIFTEPKDQSVWQYHDWLIHTFVRKGEEWLLEKDFSYMTEFESGSTSDADMKYLLLSKLKIAGRGEIEHAILKRLIQIDPLRKGYYMDLLEC